MLPETTMDHRHTPASGSEKEVEEEATQEVQGRKEWWAKGRSCSCTLPSLLLIQGEEEKEAGTSSVKGGMVFGTQPQAQEVLGQPYLTS